MPALDVIMLICGTWYITFIVTKLSGPFGIFANLKARPIFKVLKCPYCLSIWVSLGMYTLMYYGYPEPVFVFGIAGGCHLLSSWTGANYAS